MVLFDLSHAVLGTIVIGGIPAYGALQVWTLLTLRDGCRFAALLPVLIAISLAASAADSASTHAGPLATTLMFFAPVAVGYLVGLTGLSRLLQRLNWFDPLQGLASR